MCGWVLAEAVAELDAVAAVSGYEVVLVVGNVVAGYDDYGSSVCGAVDESAGSVTAAV